MGDTILQCIHDVCNKLGSILLSAKIMEKSCSTCPKHAECGGCPNISHLSTVVTCCNSIRDSVNKYRKEKKEVITGRVYDIVKTLKEIPIATWLQELAETTHLTVTLDNRIPDNSFVFLKMDCDTEGRQLLENIFFNAKKANAKSIRIVGMDCDSHIAIYFIDDGEGMDSNTIRCLGLAGTSKESTGEGTNIIKKILLQENASVEWSSPGKGAGCTVTLRLEKYISSHASLPL